jgi:fatty-acyl-CoA synthase
MRTQKFLVAGAAALALTLSACAPNAAAPAPAPGTAGSTGSAAAPADTTPVKVDIIYSKTGPLAAYGETFYEGFQAGLDHATDGTGEATAQSLRGGWLHTGDLVRRDAEGYHWVLDRIDDLYITSGENVSSVEVEQALLAHPGVARVAVVGVPDERRGEVGLAFVVRRPGVPVDEVALLEHCRERLDRFKVPAEVRFTEELPHAALEKVRRSALRGRVEA